MKILKLLFLSLAIAIASCSSNDDSSSTNNHIQIGNESFLVKSLFLETRNNYTFMYLFNKTETEIAATITNGQTLDDVNYMYLEIDQNPLNLTSYNLPNITDYELITNTMILGNELSDNGTIILESDDVNLSASTTTINIEAFTVSDIELNFSFTRADGVMITGNYSGNHATLENNTGE